MNFFKKLNPLSAVAQTTGRQLEITFVLLRVQDKIYTHDRVVLDINSINKTSLSTHITNDAFTHVFPYCAHIFIENNNNNLLLNCKKLTKQAPHLKASILGAKGSTTIVNNMRLRIHEPPTTKTELQIAFTFKRKGLYYNHGKK